MHLDFVSSAAQQLLFDIVGAAAHACVRLVSGALLPPAVAGVPIAAVVIDAAAAAAAA